MLKNATNINIKTNRQTKNTNKNTLPFDKIQICLYIYTHTLISGLSMAKDTDPTQILNKRELIALEALKILLPEVQNKRFFGHQVSYDSMAKDAVYTADAMIEALREK